jgi:SAM-dependent methyltransferase
VSLLWFRTAFNRLLRTLRRDGLIVAIPKIIRYLRWQIVAQWRLRYIRSLPKAEDRFTKIYELNFWAAKESASGPGSSLDATEVLREKLPLLFDRFSIKSVFDAPCGDFNWMRAVVDDCPVTYVGADIVGPMIESNQKRYGRAGVNFVHLDITKAAFPKSDLWFCRDCFLHLSLDDVFQTLRRFVDSGIPYALISTHKDKSEPKNFDIVTGDFRRTDLFASPFSLPEDVLFRCDDDALSEMCLWSREQIMESLEHSAPSEA